MSKAKKNSKQSETKKKNITPKHPLIEQPILKPDHQSKQPYNKNGASKINNASVINSELPPHGHDNNNMPDNNTNSAITALVELRTQFEHVENGLNETLQKAQDLLEPLVLYLAKKQNDKIEKFYNLLKNGDLYDEIEKKIQDTNQIIKDLKVKDLDVQNTSHDSKLNELKSYVNKITTEIQYINNEINIFNNKPS